MHNSFSTPRKIFYIFLLAILIFISSALVVLWEGSEFRPIILLAPAGIVLAILMLLHPELGMIILVGIIPIEGVMMVGDSSLSAAFGMLVIGFWLIHHLTARKPWHVILSSNLFKITLLILSLGFLSTLWAQFPGDVYIPLLRILRLLMIALLVMDLADSWLKFDWLAKALVMGGIMAAALTVIQYLNGDLSVSGRAGNGISGNLNNTAIVIVTIVPFAFYLIRTPHPGIWRGLSLGYLALSIIAVIASISRTSFMLLSLLLVVENWGILTRNRNRMLLITLSLIAIIVAILFIPLGPFIERMSTIPIALNYLFGGDPGNVPSNVTARGFIYHVGFAIFLDHPMLGVGFENFRRYYLVYQYIVPGANKITGGLLSSHSSYLGFLVDLGIPGLFLWLALLRSALNSLLSTYKAQSLEKQGTKFALSKATLYAFLVLALNGFAMTVQYEKLFWVLLGMSFAISTLPHHRKETYDGIQPV